MTMSRVAPGERLAVRSVSSPVGILRLVVSARGLRAVMFDGEHDGPGTTSRDVSQAIEPSRIDSTRFEPEDLLDSVQCQLAEYFDGHRTSFDIVLDPVGTTFQKAVWKVLSDIPYGTTISYAQQARVVGDARKARAVGGANGRNPIPIVVPCHRVIGSDGSLTGFSAGTHIKRFLLALEQRHVNR